MIAAAVNLNNKGQQSVPSSHNARGNHLSMHQTVLLFATTSMAVSTTSVEPLTNVTKSDDGIRITDVAFEP